MFDRSPQIRSFKIAISEIRILSAGMFKNFVQEDERSEDERKSVGEIICRLVSLLTPATGKLVLLLLVELSHSSYVVSQNL